MDMSEMITGLLVVLVVSILVIDTVSGWRAPLQKVGRVRVAAAPGRHSLDPNINCDIVWC